MKDDELDRFKTDIDLREFAASLGYELSRKESWRNSAVMRHPATHDKIIIKRAGDLHWTFYSVRDDRDHGSIIDLLQNRKKLNLGAVRQELRAWAPQISPTSSALPPLEAISKDIGRVECAFAKMKVAETGHPYLERRRALPAALLISPRFLGRIRIDKGNAVFPHENGDGLCGFELKNVNFTGFAAGGTKGLWISNTFETDERIVFCESAIDALSHAELFPDTAARYASIGGKLNPMQPELIRAAIARMPAGSEIIAAMDADEDGAKLAENVRKAFDLSGRADLRFALHEPFGHKDFNDQLRAQPKPISTRPRNDAPDF